MARSLSASARYLGYGAAAIVLVVDQAFKLWMLFVFDIAARQPIHVTPFFDLVLAWNPGISYSLFAARTDTGRWMLVGFSLLASIALAIWIWRCRDKLIGFAVGLILGGAVGNAYDRWAYGAVADFFHFFVDTQSWGRVSWYIFNIADVAIVAGVALLLYESFLPKPEPKDQESTPKQSAG